MPHCVGGKYQLQFGCPTKQTSLFRQKYLPIPCYVERQPHDEAEGRKGKL